MMKWGKKGSHSLPTYLINHVFPISWLNKLKRKGGSSQPGTKQAKRTEKVPEISRCLSMPAKWKEGRFYTGSDDPYWRLSFGEDSLQEKKGSDVRAVLYNSDDEFNVPKSSCRSSRSRSSEGNRLPLKETVAEVNDITEKVRNTQERYELKGLKAREQRLKAPAENVRKVQEQRSFDRRVLKEKKSDIDKKQERVARSTQKDIYEAKPMKPVKIRDELQKSGIDDYRGKRNLLCPSCSARLSKGNCTFDDSGIEDVNEYPEAKFTSVIPNSERKKINEMLSKNEHHRLSVHLSRRVQIKGRKPNRKINSSTGRNSAKSKCKTKEAEFVEKQKRMKRITKDMDIEAEAKTAFDSYAVPKSSYDPQQDFRDSMLEMIIEEGIKQPEDLEELLVCYLTQNYDEYHDLIIKVFRQVWFDLNHVCLSSSW